MQRLIWTQPWSFQCPFSWPIACSACGGAVILGKVPPAALEVIVPNKSHGWVSDFTSSSQPQVSNGCDLATQAFPLWVSFPVRGFVLFLPIPHKDDCCSASHTVEKMHAIKVQLNSLPTCTPTAKFPSLPVLSHYKHLLLEKPIPQNDSPGEWQPCEGHGGHWCSGFMPTTMPPTG